jgi:mRNA-degrading endonuclease toxin of MazEF toxin-antitoxin module
MVARGEIFWLPGTVVVYRASDKPRPCLVAALDNARAHLVPGTSRIATGPAVVVEAGETDLLKQTEFDFSVSFPLPLTDLVAMGRSAGALTTERLVEIDAAIAACNVVALKRLLRS